MKQNDSIIYHEAGHALVGHKVGMRIAFADMTGLTVGCPVVGLDVEPVPVPQRPRARALAALAGPIAEAQMNGGHYNWRQDGKVAEVAAKALHNADVEACARQLVQWAAEARDIITQNEKAMKRIYMALSARQFIDGDDMHLLVERAVALNEAA